MQVFLYADKAAACADAGHAGAAATHAVVQNGVPWVGVRLNQVFQQGHGLLCLMLSVRPHCHAVKFQQVVRVVRVQLNAAIASHLVNAGWIGRFVYWLIQLHQPLRVVGRLFPVEYANILNAAHRLHPGKGCAGLIVLFPIPAVAEFLPVAANQGRCEWLGSEKHRRPVGLENAAVLPPQGFHRQNMVPFAVRGAIG